MIASVLLSADLFYYFTTKQELQNVEDLFPCVHSRDSDYSTLTLELLNWQIMRFFSNACKPMMPLPAQTLKRILQLWSRHLENAVL